VLFFNQLNCQNIFKINLGGYKALRRFLIDETYRIMQQITPIVIGGQTGCGKTLLLDKINLFGQKCCFFVEKLSKHTLPNANPGTMQNFQNNH
jgi:ABC-type lipoprotein export system ATPase subunit